MRIFVCIACILLLITFSLLWKHDNNNIQNENYTKMSDVFIDFTATEELSFEQICTNLVLDKNIIKTYDLSNYSEKNAQKILLNYINTYYKEDIEMMKKSYTAATDIHKEQIKAFEYDLDNDGKNEVLGIVIDQLFFGGALGTNFYILKKNKNGEYENISELFYSYSEGIVAIMSRTTNGYHDFQFRHEENTFSSVVVQYDKEIGYRFVFLCNN